VTDLTTKHAVSDELFDRAKKLLGEQQVADLTAVAGTYVVAMILATEEGVPADKEPPFKDGEPWATIGHKLFESSQFLWRHGDAFF
jgi:hypothetical protein